ncbi:MAG: hypothetical protein ACOCZK_08145, partial [Planctomycetota bacterium]
MRGFPPVADGVAVSPVFDGGVYWFPTRRRGGWSAFLRAVPESAGGCGLGLRFVGFRCGHGLALGQAQL